jgi:hypothetical protein
VGYNLASQIHWIQNTSAMMRVVQIGRFPTQTLGLARLVGSCVLQVAVLAMQCAYDRCAYRRHDSILMFSTFSVTLLTKCAMSSTWQAFWANCPLGLNATRTVGLGRTTTTDRALTVVSNMPVESPTVCTWTTRSVNRVFRGTCSSFIL